MATYTHHPKQVRNCVFCKFWIGDARMKFVNSIVGYGYEASTREKCTKRNRAAAPAPTIRPVQRRRDFCDSYSEM